jgi:hypothetical protein
MRSSTIIMIAVAAVFGLLAVFVAQSWLEVLCLAFGPTAIFHRSPQWAYGAGSPLPSEPAGQGSVVALGSHRRMNGGN